MAHPSNRKKKHRRSRKDPDRTRAIQQREDAKRREREERRLREEAERKKAARRKRLRSLAGPVLVGLGVFGAAFLLFRPTGGPEPLEPGATVDYGTPTPVSGDYAPGDPVCGVFDEPVPAEEAVAALHAGAVVIWHDPEAGVGDDLAALAGGYDSHVLVSPNPDLEDPIVATAWDTLATFASPQDPIGEFIDAHRLDGPADGDCPMTGSAEGG